MGAKKWASGAEFIRSMPVDVPAKDVVEVGKAAGVKFTTNTVNTTRFTARQKAGRKGKRMGRVQAKPVKPGRTRSANSDALFVALEHERDVYQSRIDAINHLLQTWPSQ